MKKCLLVLTTVSLLHSFNVSAVSGNEVCSYDPRILTREYVKTNTKLKHFTWNKYKKEAVSVVNKNEKIIVKYYSCMNFGMTASLQMVKHKSTIIDDRLIRDKISFLCDKVLKKNEVQNVVNTLVKRDFFSRASRVKEIHEQIQLLPYTECVVSSFNVKNSLVLEIYWYLN